MELHFTSDEQNNTYRNAFETRQLKDGESINDYLIDIRRLGRRAFRQDGISLEPHLATKFLNGIPDLEMQNWLRLSCHRNLADLQEGAERYRDLVRVPSTKKVIPKVVAPAIKSRPFNAAVAEAPNDSSSEENTEEKASVTALQKSHHQIITMLGQTAKQVKELNQRQTAQVAAAVIPAPSFVPPPVPTGIPVAQIPTTIIPVAPAPVGIPNTPIPPRKSFVRKVECFACSGNHLASVCPTYPNYKFTEEQKLWLRQAAVAKLSGTRIGPPPINRPVEQVPVVLQPEPQAKVIQMKAPQKAKKPKAKVKVASVQTDAKSSADEDATSDSGASTQADDLKE